METFKSFSVMVCLALFVSLSETRGEWVQLGSDTIGESEGDFLGNSVSLSSNGTTVAVGAPLNGAGYVRIYSYDSGSSTWTQVGSDIDGESAGDQSGHSVSLSSDGTTVAIGAHRNDGNGTNSGHVRIYSFDSGSSTWTQMGSDIDGESTGDQSGSSVSLSSDGTTVAIGAPFNQPTNGESSGHVRIYSYDSGSSTWTQMGSDIDGEDGISIYPQSGYSVSLSSDGTTVAIGAPANDRGSSDSASGHVRIYSFDSGSSTWIQMGSDIDGESSNDWSGNSVSLSSEGTTVAIGARRNGSFSGHVRIYSYNSGSDSWTQVGSDIDGESSYDLSGYSVSLSSDGTTVAIGAIHNAGNGHESGHVRIYNYDDSTSAWNQVGSDIDGKFKSEQAGYPSLNSDGSMVAIGAPMNVPDGKEQEVGLFRVYFRDTDGDGIGNNADTDDDGDGVLDTVDAFPLDSTESVDTDGDGTGNNADDLPLDPTETVDTDGDGTGNNADTDDDNDGVLDTADAFSLHAPITISITGDSNESTQVTIALSGSGLLAQDLGHGGIASGTFGTFTTEDFSSGGFSDIVGDARLENSLSYVYIGAGINLETGVAINKGGETVVFSGSSTIDLSQHGNTFSDLVVGTYDLTDNGEWEVYFPGQTVTLNVAFTDTDGDGVADIVDLFPLDSSESADTDGDGTGNNADTDDDGDGVLDTADAFPLDSSETVDTDGDGVGDNADAFPSDASETVDTDSDGVGDNADAFPLDSSESADTDGDGTGNNADTDDDNDGVLDSDLSAQFYSGLFGVTGETSSSTANNIDIGFDGKITLGSFFSDYETLSSELNSISNLYGTSDYNFDIWVQDSGKISIRRSHPVDGNWRSGGWDLIGNQTPPDYMSNGSQYFIDIYAALRNYLRQGIFSYSTADAFPLDSTESVDTDSDGIGNNADTDDDGDGVLDTFDAFPLDSTESVDTDGDGIGNNSDPDDDNDGVFDQNDDLPLDPTDSVDTDGDGGGDNSDTDDDNDGVLDTADAFPLDSSETVDTDSDGTGNNADTDDDNDGVLDTADAFPLDYYESVDTDGDGTGNNADTDDDGDGVADTADALPLDSSESVDTDGDGTGNNADTDDDNDGVLDTADAFRLDSSESVDTDGDGTGNNADTDDDGDGVADAADALPLDSSETVDTDSDGTGNNADTDDDGDGVADTTDAFPLDSSETVDTDGDGVGDNADAFPLDPTESVDTDGDGTGNNADTDDDDDGVLDTADAFPLDSSETVDTDSDGTGNNADTDDDGDGVLDTKDAFPLDPARSIFPWVQIGSDIDGEDQNDPFGWTVSTSSDGKTVAISTDSVQKVRVFRYDPQIFDWIQIGQDIDPVGLIPYSTEWTLSLSGDGTVLAVGSPRLADKVRVLEYDDENDTWSEMRGEYGDDGNSGKIASISEDGKTLLIGNPFFQQYPKTGMIQIYNYVDSSDGPFWEKTAELLGVGEGFASLSPSGNQFTTRSGDVYMHDGTYTWNNVSHQFNNGIIASAIAISGGNSMSIEGTTTSYSSNIYQYGLVRVFRGFARSFNPEGGPPEPGEEYEWRQFGQNIEGDLSEGSFGYSMEMSYDGMTLAVGAPCHGPNEEWLGNRPGTVYVYNYDTSSSEWEKVVEIEGESGGDQFGMSVDLSRDGSILVVGAPRNSGHVGHVRIFASDKDGDGFADTVDAFPLDSSETVDTDSDGTGNNADTDDDGDGVADTADAFPLDSSESVDTDGDGTGNNADAFPLDSSESVDTDSDGTGNNADTDDDGDGVLDLLDAFPLDSSETLDVDGDGIGDNVDPSVIVPWSIVGEKIEVVDFRAASISGNGSVLAVASHIMRDGIPFNEGIVHLYEYNTRTGGWAPRGYPIEETGDSRIGDISLSSDGSVIAVGFPSGGTSATTFDGIVKIYRYEESVSEWIQLGESITNTEDSDQSPGSSTGESVNLSADGSTVIVGVPDDPYGLGKYGVYRYSPDSDLWSQMGGYIKGQFIGGTTDHSGYHSSINSDGSVVVTKGDATGIRVFSFDVNGDAWIEVGGDNRSLSGKSPVVSGDGGTIKLDLQILSFESSTGGWVTDKIFEPSGTGTRYTDMDLYASTFVIGESAGGVKIYAKTDLGAWQESGSIEVDGIGDLSLSSGGNAILLRDVDGSISIGVSVFSGDSDGDGVPDLGDPFPNDQNESLDTDGDGIGNNADNDDDGDGVLDTEDDLPLDSTETVDTDGDGLGNNKDPDDDGDGYFDGTDVFPLDSTESVDTDSDGIGNNADTDDDGDGVLDTFDAFPLDPTESVDTDGDGVGNNSDPDDDNDGVFDQNDDLPLDPTDSVDTDGDGVGDNSDELPQDPTETLDSDRDGIGNNADTDDDNDGVLDETDVFPFDPLESADSDSDGVGDNSDDLPLDPTETVDTDGDGIGNNADTDDDGDNVSDDEDAFPLDSRETVDTDGDRIGNNADADDDNDGVPDASDDLPLDPDESVDVDGDGIGDNEDIDDDNDGVSDWRDVFPLDPSESQDSDSDGVGDNSDAFPLNAGENTDFDNDGIGDNADRDDDNDGTIDKNDEFPEDASETSDRDGDGIGDNSDLDFNGDGIADDLDWYISGLMPFLGNDGSIVNSQNRDLSFRVLSWSIPSFARPGQLVESQIIIEFTDDAHPSGGYDRGSPLSISVFGNWSLDSSLKDLLSSESTGDPREERLLFEFIAPSEEGEYVLRMGSSAGLQIASKYLGENNSSTMGAYAENSFAVVSKNAGLVIPEGLSGQNGADSVLLRWDPSADDSVIGYDIYRGVLPDSESMEKINFDGPVIVSKFIDDQVDKYKTYHYRIRSVSRTGNASGFSDSVSAVVSQIEMRIDDYAGSPGSEVTLTVSANNAVGVSGEGLDIRLTYDKAILKPVAVNKTFLTQDFIVADNVSTADGQVNISAISSIGAVKSLGGLFDVVFRVDENAQLGAASSNMIVETKMFDENLNPLFVDFSDTAEFVVSNNYKLGDVNGDGEVYSQDALLAMRHALGERNIEKGSKAFMSGDINKDGLIDSADVSLILELSVNASVRMNSSRISTQSSGVIWLRTESESQSYSIELGDFEETAGGQLRVPVVVSGPSGLRGVEMQIAYDSSVLSLATVTKGGFFTDYLIGSSGVRGTEKILLSATSGSNIPTSGTVEMLFDMIGQSGSSSSLRIIDYKISGENGEDVSFYSPIVTNSVHLNDSDGDGVSDSLDLFPTDASESSDLDGDGIGDFSDSDSDGDGYTDDLETLTGGDPADASDASVTELYLSSLSIDSSVFNSARTLGRQDVQSSPSTYDLYTSSDVGSAVSASRAIVNVSARVALGGGELVTPGFVVLGTSKKLLIRAVGPKLVDLGVGNPLPNPRMTVYRTRYDGNPPDVVATIDDWKVDNSESEIQVIRSAMESAGAFPLEPTETFQGRPFMTDDTSSAATLVTLDIGVYTVQVDSADDGVGEVLVEVYEIESPSSIATSFESSDSDSDGDGYTDDLETLTGGDPADASDASVTELYLSSLSIDSSVFNSARTLGRQDVQSSPSTYDLYTSSDVGSAVSASRAIVNVSARVALGGGELVTPGFVVLGTSKKLLIRAVGPKLVDLGVGNPLPNPRMTVYRTRYDGNPPDVVATIDDWKVDNSESEIQVIRSAMESAGAFPLEPTETFQGRPFMTDDTSSAATLVTLDIGVYTVQVDSADEGVGEVLVEVYEITD